MDKVRVDGVELEVEVIGSGEPVVFIHGALIADAFRPLLSEPALTGQYRLIAYHRRGYAGSSRLTGHVTIARQASDCLALLHHLGITRAHVVGHSLGGSIALQLLLDMPEAVGTLTLMEPAMFVGESAAPYRESLRKGATRAAEVGAATAVDGFLEARWMGYRKPLDRLVPGGFEQAVRDANDQFTHELPAVLDWTFGEDEARRIAPPVLALIGGANEYPGTRFREVHRFLLATLPDVEGVVMPGLEHMLQLQDPTSVATVLAGFLGRHPLADQ